MSYSIAVATDDGNTVNQHFGMATSYYIYKVDNLSCEFIHKRVYIPQESKDEAVSGGCCAQAAARVQLLKDCRCVVAECMGFKIQKQFSQMGISVFDGLTCPIEEALKAISKYFYKIDNHIPISKNENV